MAADVPGRQGRRCRGDRLRGAGVARGLLEPGPRVVDRPAAHDARSIFSSVASALPSSKSTSPFRASMTVASFRDAAVRSCAGLPRARCSLPRIRSCGGRLELGREQLVVRVAGESAQHFEQVHVERIVAAVADGEHERLVLPRFVCLHELGHRAGMQFADPVLGPGRHEGERAPSGRFRQGGDAGGHDGRGRRLRPDGAAERFVGEPRAPSTTFDQVRHREEPRAPSTTFDQVRHREEPRAPRTTLRVRSGIGKSLGPHARRFGSGKSLGPHPRRFGFRSGIGKSLSARLKD